MSIMKKLFLLTAFIVSALSSNAQTYIQYVDSAEFYIHKQRWSDAERMTISALKSKPANKLNYILWSNLGDIRTHLQDYTGALQAFEIAVTTAPRKERILNNRAFTYLEMGDSENALTDINDSLLLDSIQEWPLRTRGMLALNAGDYQKAEHDFNLLRKHFPNNPTSYSGLGKIYATKGETDKAIKSFEKSLELNQDEDTWFYLVLVNIEADRIPTAKDYLLTALKRYPRSGNLFLLRGVIHKKYYENESAEIDRKIAIDYGADPHLVDRLLPKLQK